ncbi:MAG TPA: hypothetical protein VGE67_03495, partial [Haloferula sp.]
MAATRRGRDSLPDIRAKERVLLREWAVANGLLLGEDPTLTLERRSSHGEHTVGFDPDSGLWWKTTHPGKAGVGVEFQYDLIPPFSVTGAFARDLLPSEYLVRMILHNRQFGDDVRFEGYLDHHEPSLVVSQPDIGGTPATAEQMSEQMALLGFLPLGPLQIGKPNAISFYHPGQRIAMF